MAASGDKNFDSAQSYFDTATTAVYCVLRLDKGSAWDGRIATINRSTRAGRSALISELAMDLLLDEFWPIFLHEWHHLFQTIIYPQRYLQSARELRVALGALTTFLKTREPLTINDLSIDNDSPVGDLIAGPHQPMYLKEVNGRLNNAEPNDLHSRYLGRITEIDLLEEATSIFQYRLTAERLAKGYEYAAWLEREQRVYRRVFRLLCKVMGRDDAFAAIPVLTLQAFRTTNPKNSFANLVNVTLDRKVRPSRMPEEEYHNWLAQLVARLDPISCDPYSYIRETDPPRLITTEEHLRIIGATPLHPCHILARMFWEHVAEGKITPGQLLFHLGGSSAQADFVIHNLLPPMIVAFVSHPDLRHPAIVGITNAKLKRDLPPGLLTDRLPDGRVLTYEHIVNDGVRAKNIAYGMMSDYERRIPHNCRHLACPYHPTEVCRRWLPTPADWRRCTFPGYFIYRTNHLLDPADRKATWLPWGNLVARNIKAMPTWWEAGWTPPENMQPEQWFSLSMEPERGGW